MEAMTIFQTRTDAIEVASKGQFLPEYWRMISLSAFSFSTGSMSSAMVPLPITLSYVMDHLQAECESRRSSTFRSSSKQTRWLASKCSIFLPSTAVYLPKHDLEADEWFLGKQW